MLARSSVKFGNHHVSICCKRPALTVLPMAQRLELCATVPLKGRDSRAETIKRRTHHDPIIETPEMPFDAPPVKIRRTSIPPRASTSMESKRRQNTDNSYAFKFNDSTWGHSDVSVKDQPVTRDQVRNLAFKYQKNIDMVAGYKGIELAQRLQAINDLLLDEMISQFRVINLGQAELLEQCRGLYARIFTILDEDAVAQKNMVYQLKAEIKDMQDKKEKEVKEMRDRMKYVEEECNRKVDEANHKLDEKSAEYDEAMEAAMAQRVQMEDHVRTLHRVFLDFQSDAVYLTLEDLKNQLTQANMKLQEKTEEISTLQLTIMKWKVRSEESHNKRQELEGVIDDLRNQLMESDAKNASLSRQLDILKMDMADLIGEDPGQVTSEQASDGKDGEPVVTFSHEKMAQARMRAVQRQLGGHLLRTNPSCTEIQKIGISRLGGSSTRG